MQSHEGRGFKNMAIFAFALSLLVSNSYFSIKTSALWWFTCGCLWNCSPNVLAAKRNLVEARVIAQVGVSWSIKKYVPVGVGTLAHSPGSLSVGRDARIDAAKGLGIFLVVLGHAKGLPEWWVVLIYSFHVPLFFLLSGWAAGTNMRQSGFCECLLHLMRTLLVPYVFFFRWLYLLVAYTSYWCEGFALGDAPLVGAVEWFVDGWRNCFVCPAVVVVSSSIVCDEINLSSVV